MEDLLDLYAEAFDPRRPVVCFDELPYQLVAETCLPLPLRPGKPIRYDYEYRRNGTCNLFMFFQPLAGWRHVEVTEQRTKRDFAYRMKTDPAQLAELRSFLQTERSFLLSLLENPNILDHESFTNLLWAVFHVAEELSFREGDLAALPKSDLVHIAGDLSRGYSQIVVQWLAYAEHLKASYPFLYSLAVRINPLGAHPSAVVEEP